MNVYELFRHWDSDVHSVTISALNSMNAEQLRWVPDGWHSSAQDLAFHMCNVEWQWFYRNVLKLEPWETRWSSKTFTGLPDLLDYWQRVHAETVNWLQSLPVSSLNDRFEMPWSDRPTLSHILFHVLEHEIHHRGQIIMLMRMQGLTPPSI